MTLLIQSHGGERRAPEPRISSDLNIRTTALVPAADDVAPDEAADLGFLFPPSGNPGDYLPSDVLDELDELGNRMVPDPGSDPDPTVDSTLPAVMTYWGQFLDHELTARTDREGEVTNIETPSPIASFEDIETKLKNARSPRFDLDSVYGGIAIGPDLPPAVATVISGMRHPDNPAMMRVGTTLTGEGDGPVPDGLDAHRDLPRFRQVQQSVRDAYLELAQARLSPADFAKFRDSLPSRAIIGDMRNEENLIIAQFHLSFLRFHNRAVMYLENNPTGWIPDFASGKELTRLHYQWLSIEVYLKAICDPAVVDRVLTEKARHFFEFRDAYYGRNAERTLGNVLPLEFSVAAFRFGHTMVRGVYDYNHVFGRSEPGQTNLLPQAPFDLMFGFTAGGGFRPSPGAEPKSRLPANWIIDWTRFLTADTSFPDEPQRSARSLDTQLAPPMGDLLNEGGDAAPGSEAHKLFRHLARRNLRRGFSLRLPTGQALHQHLNAAGAVTSGPISDAASLLVNKPDLADFLRNSTARLHERTPLWFYVLAEAEAAGGNHLGELGSWIVASTFIAVMLSDPDSALSRGFTPDQSPLRMPDGSVIDSLEKWMRFAIVLE